MDLTNAAQQPLIIDLLGARMAILPSIITVVV
jgi:hypothetical protein